MSHCQQTRTNVVVIGAGSGKGQDYLTALLERPNDVNIVGIVINKNMPTKVEEWASKYHWKVITDGNIKELLETTAFDTAIVSLPHDQHDAVTKMLLNKGIFVIKEKPLAMTLKEAEFYKTFIAEKKCQPIFTTVQRSTHPLFLQAKADFQTLGKPLSFTYTYTFNLAQQTSGWRADPLKSGGGVVLDMGYHAIDVVNDFFGYPDQIKAEFGYKFAEMEQNRLEDSANIALQYKDCKGSIILNRHAEKRDESFVIQTEAGKIILTPTAYELYIGNDCVKKVEMSLSKTEIIQKMFDASFALTADQSQKQFDRNMDTMRLIDAVYSQKK